jgi:hypothetical protein
LRRAIDELKDNPADLGPDDEFSLDFLSPSDRPECLGRLGPYEVSESVGRGGMGVVLKALDPSLNRVVAIKVMTPQLATSGAARRRFAREARAAAAVSHEHVVTIHGVDTAGQLPYLVMQYVPGPSLQERLDRSGPLEVKEILRIGMQTASGLAAAHAQGLIHRDVKPANILLEDGLERVKLTDFGLARARDDVAITQSAVLAGTPQYMAPEQARGEGLDYRADLFSLGSVLYTMCTGRPPFRAGAPLAVLKRVCEDTPRSIRELNPHIPQWLSRIIMKLMAKDPVDRFQSAGEVAELLGRCLAHVQQPRLVPLPHIPSVKGLRPARPPVWRRTRMLAAAIVALAVLGLGTAEATGVTNVVDSVATVLRIRTADGTLVIEVEDPGIKVAIDGEEITITGAGIQELKVRPGEHKVRAMKDGKALEELVTITRGGKQVVKVTRERLGADGKPVATGNADGTIQFWQAGPGNQANAWLAPRGPVSQGVFSPDGKLLATGSVDGTVHLLDAATGRLLATLKGHQAAILSLKFLPGGKVLVTVSAEGVIKLWDVATHKEVTAVDLPIRPLQTVLSPDGTSVAGAADNLAVRVWEVKTGKQLAVLEGTAGGLQALAFSPNEVLIAGSTPPGIVHLWDVGSGQVIRRLDAHPSPAQDTLKWVVRKDRSLAFSPDGRVLACGTGEAEIQLWDVATSKPLRRLKAHKADVTSVAFSPDGRRLASAGEDNTVRLWDVADGKVVLTFVGRGITVSSVTFSPDGRRVLTTSAEGSVRLWDAATGKEVTPAISKPAGQDESRAAPRIPEKRYTLEMLNEPWGKVLEWLADQSGLPFVGDVKPERNFSFMSLGKKQSYTLGEIIDILNEGLATQKQKLVLLRRDRSLTLVRTDDEDLGRLLPRVRIEDLGGRGKTELVIVAVPLKFQSAEDLAPSVRKMMGPLGMVSILARENQLELRDTAGNLRRLVQVIQDTDREKKPPH